MVVLPNFVLAFNTKCESTSTHQSKGCNLWCLVQDSLSGGNKLKSAYLYLLIENFSFL